MPRDVIITPASGLVDFKDDAGNIDAKIQIDTVGNLSITNQNGNLTIGDSSTNVYIGDGVNSSDIIFEQNGAIRALSGKTLTIGSSNSSVIIAGNVALSSTNLDIAVNRIKSINYTSSNTDLQTFDSFAVSAFRSAQYNVQLSSGTDYYVINLSLVHDGTTVYLSQYGEIFDNVALGTFDATIASSNVNVQFTPANATTNLKSLVILIST